MLTIKPVLSSRYNATCMCVVTYRYASYKYFVLTFTCVFLIIICFYLILNSERKRFIINYAASCLKVRKKYKNRRFPIRE